MPIQRIWHRCGRTGGISSLIRADGATAIEFAIVLPILLLLGILEYSIILYGMATLDGALTEAAREGATGYSGTSSGQTRQQYVYSLVANRVSGLFDPAQLQISSRSFPSFATLTPPTPCTNPPPPAPPACPDDVGAANSIVEYTAAYPWPITTPLLQYLIGTGGTFMISASALVMNEPFSETGSSPVITPTTYTTLQPWPNSNPPSGGGVWVPPPNPPPGQVN